MDDKNTLLFKELDGTFKSLEVERISITSIYSLYAYDRIRRYVESDTLLSSNDLKEKNACDHVSKYFPRPTKYYSDIIEEEETVKTDLLGKITEYYFSEGNDEILHSTKPFEKEWLVLEILHDENIRSDRNALKIRYQNTLIGWVSKYDYEGSVNMAEIINNFCFDDFTELKPSLFMIYDGEQYLLIDIYKEPSEESNFERKEIIDDEGYQNFVQNRSYKSTTSIANSLGMDSYELFLILLEHKLIDKPFYISKKGVGRRGSTLDSEKMVKRYYNKNYNLTEKGIEIGGKYKRKTVDRYTLGITDEFDPSGQQWVVWDTNAIETIKALVSDNNLTGKIDNMKDINANDVSNMKGLMSKMISCVINYPSIVNDPESSGVIEERAKKLPESDILMELIHSAQIEPDITKEARIKPYEDKRLDEIIAGNKVVFPRLKKLSVMDPFLSENEAKIEFMAALTAAENQQQRKSTKASIQSDKTNAEVKKIADDISRRKISSGDDNKSKLEENQNSEESESIDDDNLEIENTENARSTTNEILNLLSESPGLRAKEIASKLEIDKTDVNKLLYGNLNGQVRYNNSYEWFIRGSSDSSIEINEVTNVPLTDIARLCRYYLACLGQEEAGISTFAESQYDLDYGELKSFPRNADELISEESYQKLQGKKRADRSRLQMFLGYPTNLRHAKSTKSDWEGCFVEPLFLFPIERDTADKSIQIDFSYPIINTKILLSFTNSDKDALMDELVQLEEELGISSNTEAIIELDEMVMRLQHIRTEWPWQEDIIPQEINDEGLKLSEIKQPGIFNKAIVVVAEKSPYTAGLEGELTQLSKCSIESFKETALGTWLAGNRTSNEQINDEVAKPLIEVLPMNSEQRQAVHSSLNQDLTVITGPPGTGKSQVVTNLLVNSAWRDKKILFASKNNKAVDVVEIRINNLGPRPILLRVGSQAYQRKLAEYLMALLSTTSTKTDQLEFTEAEEIHTKLLKQSDSLDKDVEKLIENRNRVDVLEQSVEEIRSRIDEKTFLSFNLIDSSKLKADIKILTGEVNKLIENRNQINELHQSVEEIRSRIDEKTFLSFKNFDISKLNTDIALLNKLLVSLKKKGLFWFLRKNGLYKTANMKLKNTTQFVEDLSLSTPDNSITESNLSDWRNFTNDLKELAVDANSISEYCIALEELQTTELYSSANSNLNEIIQFVENLSLSTPDNLITESNLSDWRQFSIQLESEASDVESVKKYFAALTKLKSTKNLEDISWERNEIFESMARNSEILWKLWLKLQPSKLSQDDRDLLTRYRAILQMVIDTKEGERLENNVYREYKKASDQIAHLLPCWAVTSLSVRNKVAFEPGFFDIVVFDESSQCDIASALPLLYRAKTAVIIGDPKQLTHISSLRRGQDQQLLDKFGLLSTHPHWAYSYNSLFALGAGLSSQNTIINLVDHHRSHSDIIEFSNKEFYEDRLRIATRYENLRLVDSKEPGIRWVNIQGQSRKSPSGGSLNNLEVQAVINELIELVLVRGYKGTIGVVTPFRAQANAIDAAIIKNNELHRTLLNQDYIANTVHKFQGDERDVMIFSPVLSKGMSSGSIYYLQNQGNLFNVAITRARAQLIVIGDLSECGSCDVGYLAKFAQYTQNLIRQNDEINQSIELEYGTSKKYPPVDNPEQVSDWEKEFYSDLYIAGVKTLPQYRVEKYVLDLAIVDGERKLDIEIDGEKYHRNWNGELCHRDQIRNQRMYELGWDVIRFWVYEIRDDLPSCIEKIKQWQAQTDN